MYSSFIPHSWDLSVIKLLLLLLLRHICNVFKRLRHYCNIVIQYNSERFKVSHDHTQYIMMPPKDSYFRHKIIFI